MTTKRAVTMWCVTMCGAVLCSLGPAVAQTEWVQYPDNPVFTPPSGYEGWGRAIVWDGSRYHMIFYLEEGLGHATSTDGVEWTVDPASPVLAPGPTGAWDSQGLSPGALVFDDGVFSLWYSGCHREFPVVPCSVGYATSPNGSVWTKHVDNPVLGVGPAGSFDAYALVPGGVVFSEGVYRMWYSALDQPSGAVTIGYAESPDRVSWTRHPTPVLEPGPGWDDTEVWAPAVVYDGSGYHMWYAGGPGGRNGSIGYAHSANGIEWFEYPGNPVIRNAHGATNPEVIFDGSTCHMWYLVGGGTWNFSPDEIYYATSDSAAGLPYWQVIPAAALASGAEGAFFQTDVEISNTGEEDAEVTFAWLPRGQDNVDPLVSGPYVLAAGESRYFENSLAEIFGLGPDSTGALRLTSSSESVIGMSRTYNLPDDETGTFGQGMPAVPAGDMIAGGERRRITFLCENAYERANVGCVNGTDRPVQINIGVHDGAGVQLDVKTMILGPYGNDQIHRVLQPWQPTRGYVDVWSDTGGALFTCYGSLVDNLTNDPMTVLPQ